MLDLRQTSNVKVVLQVINIFCIVMQVIIIIFVGTYNANYGSTSNSACLTCPAGNQCIFVAAQVIIMLFCRNIQPKYWIYVKHRLSTMPCW